MRAANAVRGFFNVVCFLILIGAFVEFAAEEPLFPGITFASTNTVLAAIMVIVLVNLAAAQTIKDGNKKYGSSGQMLCPNCQEMVKVEADQAHQAALAEAEKWKAELKGMTETNPTLGTVVKEWRSANQDAMPSRSVVDALRNAINLEKAGNFEGAARIFEENKLWSMAGKVREKDRVQTVKHVTVDMNQLIEQIGSRGLAVPYKCHNCGAGITIDKNSSVSGLKFCSYCGSAYNIEDMSKIVQEALG